MLDGTTVTFAKAIDGLSGKIFIPGLIVSLLVEFSGYYKEIRADASFIEIYSVFAILGYVGSYFILIAITECMIRFNASHKFPSKIGLLLMPLGFIGVIPDYITQLHVPYSQVTGVAIITWSFFLINTDIVEFLYTES